MSKYWGYILVALSAVVLGALPSLFGSSLSATTLLVLVTLILSGTVVLWTLRTGILSPVPLISAGLLVYFPVRGLLISVAQLGTAQGINGKVLAALTERNAQDVALILLVSTLGFTAAAEVFWRAIAWKGHRVRGDNYEVSLQLGKWARPLLVVGLICLASTLSQSLAFLRGTDPNAGLVGQVLLLGEFCFGLGLVFSGNPRLGRFASYATGAAVSVAIISGSKDELFLVLMALLLSRARIGARIGGARTYLAVGIALAICVFAVFPALASYRRAIQNGHSLGEAIAGVPIDLGSHSAFRGDPRSTGGFVGYVEDSLLYATDRFHGYDSLLLIANHPSDPSVLHLESLAMSPLGVVIPSRLWSNDVQDVGLYFGHAIWGLPASDNTRIAITLIGQMDLAFGIGGAVLAGLLLGASAGIAASYWTSESMALRAVAFTLLISTLAFERDALLLFVTTERRLAIIGGLVLLAMLAARKSQRLATLVDPLPHPEAGFALGARRWSDSGPRG